MRQSFKKLCGNETISQRKLVHSYILNHGIQKMLGCRCLACMASNLYILPNSFGKHNIIPIHNDVMWDWWYSTNIPQYFLHYVWMWDIEENIPQRHKYWRIFCGMMSISHNHNIIHVHNNILREWEYSVIYSHTRTKCRDYSVEECQFDVTLLRILIMLWHCYGYE